MDRYNNRRDSRNNGPWERYRSEGTKTLDDTYRREGGEVGQGSGKEALTAKDEGPQGRKALTVYTAGETLDGLDTDTEGAPEGAAVNRGVSRQGSGSGESGVDESDDEPNTAAGVNPIQPLLNGNKGEESNDDESVGDTGSRDGGERGDIVPDGETDGRALDAREVVNKLDLVSALLNKMDIKSDKLAVTVRELQVSFEYSQSEIDKLKGENSKLKLKPSDLETEDRRATYQQKRIEERIDRVDTASKKRNLVP